MPSAFDYNPTVDSIDEAMVMQHTHQTPRGHLGMSSIADDARTLWLKFRWSLPDNVDGRLLRIFELGDRIEDMLAEKLRLAGFVLHTHNAQGDQFRFSEHGGHYAGSMDGAIKGLAESDQWHVWECKSVNTKRFAALKKEGVEKWSPTYYGQMQCYMHHSGMTRALFMAMDKDNSEIYTERVKVEPMYGPAMMTKALAILTEDVPESTYRDRSWYEIRNYKSEHYQRVYWGDELPPAANCRNCRFSVADVTQPGANWHCLQKQRILTIEDQQIGCKQHNFIPSLMPAEQIAIDGATVVYRHSKGFDFINGPGGYSSDELIALSQQDFPQEFMRDIETFRVEFDARIEQVTAA